MAQQLVYTSAARLLDAGRSGFGTVARSKSLSPLIVSAIERVSQFANIRGTDRSRVIFAHRRIVAANNRVHVISRIADAGVDYTGRTNHIAHHLIVSSEEMARLADRGITPADVLMQFPWLTRWDAGPRFFGPEDDVHLDQTVQPSGRNSARTQWTRLTGNPSHARLLAWEGAPRSGVVIVLEQQQGLMLLAEALAETGSQSWSRTFTTSLETTDDMSDFDWVISGLEAFREIESRCGNRSRLDLTQPHSLPVPPEPVKRLQELPEERITSDSSQTNTAQKTATHPIPQVNVRSGTVRKSPVVLMAPPTRSSKPMALILAAAVAVVMVAIIVWKVAVPTSPKGIEKSPAEISQDWKNAVNEMTALGISKTEAEAVATDAKEGTAMAWAGFIKESVDWIKGDKDSDFNDLDANLPSLPVGESPKTNANWLECLVNASKLPADLSGMANSYNLRLRLEHLTKITKSLNSAAKAELTILSAEDCARFDARFTEKLIAGSKIADLKAAIKGGMFDLPDYRCRYDGLARHISQEFRKNDTKELREIGDIIKTANEEEKNNVNGLIIALDNRESPALINEDQCTLVKESPFVPQEFKSGLKTRAEREQKGAQSVATGAGDREKGAAKPSGTDAFAGVPDKEIIVVSRKQLEEGVEVALLKAWMKNESGNPRVEVNGEPIKIVKVQGDDYYSENWNDKKNYNNFKLENGGLVSHARQGVTEIVITSEIGARALKSWIVLDDDAKGKSINQHLKYDVKPDGSDKAIICGELEKYIQNTRISGNLYLAWGNQAKIAVNTGECVFVKRSEQFAPQMVFSQNAINSIESALKNVQDMDVSCKRANGGTEKKNLNQKLDGSKDELFDAIESAIGGAVISKNIGVSDDAAINESHRSKINEFLKSIKVESAGKGTDWNRELKDAKQKVGEKQVPENLRTILPSEGDWNKIKNKGIDDLVKCIRSIIGRYRRPEPRPALADDIAAAASIKISTEKGRVLFEASK